MALPKRFTLRGMVITIHNRSAVGLALAEQNMVLMSVDREGEEAFFNSEEDTVKEWLKRATDIEYE